MVPTGKLPPRESPLREAEETEVIETASAAPAKAQPQRARPKETKPTPQEARPRKTPRSVQPARVIAQQQAVALPFQAATAVGADVDELPRKMANNPAPIYPTRALLAGEEGRVMLRVVIRIDGLVDSAEVATSSGSSELDASALAAVRRWRFTAARRAGAAVVHEVLVPVLFSIRR